MVKASRDKKVFDCATFNILLKKSFIEANKNVQQKQMRNVESFEHSDKVCVTSTGDLRHATLQKDENLVSELKKGVQTETILS